MNTTEQTPLDREKALIFKRARRLVSLLTQYDQSQRGKRGYNPYALGHYIGAAHAWEESELTRSDPIESLAGLFTSQYDEGRIFSLKPVRQFVKEIQSGRI